MQEALVPLSVQYGLRVKWVDIDDDELLEEKYGALIPALIGEAGELICFYHLNLAALDAYLQKIR
jgi:thioredoxin reductase (NADPH)